MDILVAGASGATGRLLALQLLGRGHAVRAIVRSPEKLPDALREHDNLTVIQASILDLGDGELAEYVAGCAAVASCLGHNMTLQGMFGPPRRLVADAVRRLCQAIVANHPEARTKFVLMNTVGNRNRDLQEPVSFADKVATGLMRLLVPPHRDNEKAADFLRTEVGRGHEQIEWVAVRPDDLIDEDEVSPYECHPSPLWSALSGPGQTSRINVAHFMAELITNEACWQRWQGQMPVIYNS